VTGRHPGRTSDDQRIFSSPVGLAIEDVAAAARVYRKAEDSGSAPSSRSGGPDLGLILLELELQFSHRKTRARTLRLWPPHRGQRRQMPATAQSIGSVVSPG
jgi:hypothetical protein